jgi:hypothetical protein
MLFSFEMGFCVSETAAFANEAGRAIQDILCRRTIASFVA